MVEQRNSNSGTVWWNSMVERWNSDGRTVLVEQSNSDGRTVEQFWWNRETVILEQWNSDGETVWWWKSVGGTVKE